VPTTGRGLEIAIYATKYIAITAEALHELDGSPAADGEQEFTDMPVDDGGVKLPQLRDDFRKTRKPARFGRPFQGSGSLSTLVHDRAEGQRKSVAKMRVSERYLGVITSCYRRCLLTTKWVESTGLRLYR
jgi:hypothetical protein